jgi:SAM-dependent methyltransferase
MTKLSELVRFKNNVRDIIDSLSLDNVISEKLLTIENLRPKFDQSEYDYGQYIDQYTKIYQKLLSDNDDIINFMHQSLKEIEDGIKVLGTTLSQESNEYFLWANSEVTSVVQSRISSYSSWQYPGLQLNCRYLQVVSENEMKPLSEFKMKYVDARDHINSMVASDPLYLASSNMSDLNRIISTYPDVYQRRVRIYDITNFDLSPLPQSQFGFILCWDFLNYVLFDRIESYFRSIFNLLRPGGVLMFSYNNCDMESSATLVDSKQACWANSDQMKKLAQIVGFEIVATYDLESKFTSTPTWTILDETIPDPHRHDWETNGWTSWIEVRRPGTLTTIKLGQAMGIIQSK